MSSLSLERSGLRTKIEELLYKMRSPDNFYYH